MADTGKTIALIKALSGGGGLPPVTESDAGKVLAVDNSGVWGASGNIELTGTRSGDNVTITTSPLPTHADFVNAYNMGRGITLVLNTTEKLYLAPFERETGAGEDSVVFCGVGFDFDIRKTAVWIRSNSYGGTDDVNVRLYSLDPFIVTLTPTALDYSGTMDKTVAEIDAAYKAGQEIVFRVYVSSSVYYEIGCTDVYRDQGFVYPRYCAVFVYDNADVIVKISTPLSDDGIAQTYGTVVYPLTPAT